MLALAITLYVLGAVVSAECANDAMKEAGRKSHWAGSVMVMLIWPFIVVLAIIAGAIEAFGRRVK